jgi:hypothetical protein
MGALLWRAVAPEMCADYSRLPAIPQTNCKPFAESGPRRPGRSLRRARLVVAVKDLGVEVETFGDRCAPLRVRVEEGLGPFYT